MIYRRNSVYSKPGKRDFILTSFPKSGNTWISFIIANIYNLSAGKYQEIDFHNIHEINPELGLEPKKDRVFKEFPQVFLSHQKYNKNFHNVILMIRDPWDVLYSYYHYLKGERKKDISLPEVISHKTYGIHALVEHNESYFKKCRNLLILTYERMQKNPLKQIKALMDFMSIKLDESILLESIRKSDFNSMREVEIRKGRKYGTKGFLFTRKGVIGEGKINICSQPEIDLIIRTAIKSSPFLSYLYL